MIGLDAGAPIGAPGRWVSTLSLFPLPLANDSSDQTSLVRSILGDATPKFFPPGRYNCKGLMDVACRGIYGVPGQTFIYLMSDDGKDVRWDVNGIDDFVCYGVTFVVPGTPAGATNNADESDAILRIRNCHNARVERCEFWNAFGTCVLFRAVDGGEISHCRIVTCYKDGFHITGESRDIRRTNCVVINGGDDAFAVVGYLEGSGSGQPEGIIDTSNIVRGVKFARGFAYIGAKRCQNIGCTVDGAIPAEFEPDSGHVCESALHIHSESGIGAYHNQDIEVIGFRAENCGDSTHGAIDIRARGSVDVSRNIRVQATVKRSPKQLVYIDGGSTKGQLEDVHVQIDAEDCTDPNGVSGAAGAGSATGIEIKNCANFSVQGSLAETGGIGVFIGNTNSGKGKVHLVTKRINKSGTAGLHIISGEAASGSDTGAELDINLTVAEQDASATVATTPYFVQTAMTLGAGIRAKWKYVPLVKDLDKGVSVATAPAQTITVGESPFVWVPRQTVTTAGEDTAEVDLPYPVSVRISGGTVTKIETAMYSGVAAPVWVEPIPGAAKGRFHLDPGMAIRVTYEVAPTTMAYVPCVS